MNFILKYVIIILFKRNLTSLNNAIKKIFFHGPVQKNSLSLHLIDILAKLYFHEKREVESFKSFEEPNNQNWSSYHEFTMVYSVEIKEEYCSFYDKNS